MINRLKILTILFLFIFLNHSFAMLVVKEWHQDNTIKNLGQEINIKIKLTAEGLSERYYHNYWIYNIGNSDAVKFIDGKVLNDKGNGKVSFKNGEIRFDFKKTFNGENVFLELKYFVENKELEEIPYIRREFVYIPKNTKNAKASIVVDFSELSDLQVYSLNDKFQKEDGKYIWIGNVPKDGFNDEFDFTATKARWLLETYMKIRDENNIGNLSVKTPLYYVGGGNSLLNLNISNNQYDNIDYRNIKYDDENIFIKFNNFNSVDGFVKIEGIIENSYNNSFWVSSLDPNKYLEINQELSLTLNNIINLLKNNNINNEPIHILLAKWVHNNIKYNLDLVGKNLTTKEILLRKEGVCSHMSLIYRDMLRAINIPATAVSGMAYDFRNKVFDGHSWVLVYYNDQWIPIDPTWGIYSGRLPISHIFVYKNLNDNFFYEKSGENVSMEKFSVDITRNVKFLN